MSHAAGGVVVEVCGAGAAGGVFEQSVVVVREVDRAKGMARRGEPATGVIGEGLGRGGGGPGARFGGEAPESVIAAGDGDPAGAELLGQQAAGVVAEHPTAID